MKTADLIAVLSSEAPRRSRFTSMAAVASAGLAALGLVLVLSLTLLRTRDDLSVALVVHDHIFLLKVVFASAVIATALPIVRDLAVPGRQVGWGSLLAAAPFLIILMLALRELTALPSDQWSHHVGLASWFECLWKIPVLAAPAFVLLAVAVRSLAPTDLVLAGAYVGLLAGGMGALGYAFHCHDNDVTLVAFSYTSAIAEMTLIGALLGPRVLRWP